MLPKAGRTQDRTSALCDLGADLGQRNRVLPALHQLHPEKFLKLANLHGKRRLAGNVYRGVSGGGAPWPQFSRPETVSSSLTISSSKSSALQICKTLWLSVLNLIKTCIPRMNH